MSRSDEAAPQKRDNLLHGRPRSGVESQVVDVRGDVVAARRALSERAWATALDLFVAADAEAVLSAEDLVGMSDASFWSGNVPRALDAMQRAHSGFVAEGDLAKAADAALVACRLCAMQGDLAVAGGWLERARRDLVDVPECSAHAHLAFMETYALLLFKDYAQVAAGARDVEAIAARVGDRRFVVLARSLQGFAAVHAGDVVAGMRLLDEALATALADELDLFSSAEVFCEMVVASLAVADYQRAAEWLDAAERSDRIVCFPGCCRVHRTTVLRHRGEWDQARQHAERARAEVAGVETYHEGMALTELGELHRYKGDLALAERAFGQAYEKGWAPQPGLALVLLAKDDPVGASRMIDRSVEHAEQELGSLVSLLPAQVEIAIASGDVDAAEAASRRLAEVAARLASSAAQAANACATGMVLHARGDLAGAARELARGIRTWLAARDPYEAARARLHLAATLEALGDTPSARLELTAARAAFEKLGASPEAAEAARRLGDDQPVHATRTFMFTDIVNSTELLTTIGDDAWHGVHQWHDRTVNDIVGEHEGRIIKDTGDGFFVAFAESAMAVDCAIALQRALEAHRRAEGFSPAVRIGLHLGSAVENEGDYLGRDVVIAARIGAAAGPDEILISGELADGLGGHVRVAQRESRTLKGISEMVEVTTVNWR